MDSVAIKKAIVLVGVTGVGKSTLCNYIFQIFGRRRVFKCGASLLAVTDQLQTECIGFQGKLFTIVDNPGFFDTQQNSTAESTARKDGENMCKLVNALERCESIYCIVFVFTERFSTPQKMW